MYCSPDPRRPPKPKRIGFAILTGHGVDTNLYKEGQLEKYTSTQEIK